MMIGGLSTLHARLDQWHGVAVGVWEFWQKKGQGSKVKDQMSKVLVFCCCHKISQKYTYYPCLTVSIADMCGKIWDIFFSCTISYAVCIYQNRVCNLLSLNHLWYYYYYIPFLSRILFHRKNNFNTKKSVVK